MRMRPPSHDKRERDSSNSFNGLNYSTSRSAVTLLYPGWPTPLLLWSLLHLRPCLAGDHRATTMFGMVITRCARAQLPL